ncbi:MAG: tetratricopeptide repeat protein [Gammaproteobacteria bacterium]|nr:tetratricopeptide repeat protein [Gammaproteobacteria bacterium]
MNTLNRIVFEAPRVVMVLVVSTLVLAGCATTEPSRARANVETTDDVGFTITEDARVSGGVRTDYQLALDYLQQGRHAEGVALLESVAAEAPRLSAPRIDLGIAYHRAGDLDAAERNLLLALEANPGHPVALNELGIVYRKTGRFAQARASYESALAVYPNLHYARRNLAVLCDLYLSDLACALDNYEAYMTTVPSDDEASIWISDIRARLGQAAE